MHEPGKVDLSMDFLQNDVLHDSTFENIVENIAYLL